MRRPARLHSRQRGSYLLESLIAVVLFSFGVLALVGTLANSVRATNDARYRSEAANLAGYLFERTRSVKAADASEAERQTDIGIR